MESADSVAPTYDIEVREPRCRVCRHEYIRVMVNGLLDWRGVPVAPGCRRSHRVTFADVARDLEGLNETLPARERLTYASVWNHAKRHYSIEGAAAYWSKRSRRELQRAVSGGRRRGLASPSIEKV